MIQIVIYKNFARKNKMKTIKKTLLSYIILLLFIIHTPSHAMYRCMQITAASSISMYTVFKAVAKYEEITTEPLPPAVEKWSRERMEEKGIKHADTIPLRMWNHGWGLAGGTVILANKNDIQKLDDHLNNRRTNHKNLLSCEATLGHESGHYHHRHNEKYIAFTSTLISILFTEWKTNKTLMHNCYQYCPRLYSAAPWCSLCLKLGIFATGAIGICRYNESEADQFACTTARTLEELNHTFDDYSSQARYFENRLLYRPESFNYNPVTNFILLQLSKKINALNFGYYPAKEDRLLQKKKERLIRIAHFFTDPLHPYYTDRATMAKKYANQWNKKNEIRSITRNNNE
jgi:hypothetical protein